MDYNKLEQLRKQKKLTIEEMADKIGMTKNGLYLTLKNKTLRVDTLELIASLLGVQMSFFFDPNGTIILDKKTQKNDTETKIFYLNQEVIHLKEVIKLKDEVITELRKRFDTK